MKKIREDQRSVRRDKMNSTIALETEPEAVADSNDFATIYSSTEKLASGRKRFDGPARLDGLSLELLRAASAELLLALVCK